MTEIEDILKTLDNDENEFLLNHTRSSIQQVKNDILQKLQLSSKELKEIHKKLKPYRYVEDLTHLKYGSYIRWIKITNPDNIKLTNGGIVTDIKFNKTGCNVLCKNNMNRFFEIKFDECIIFQKMTDQENVLLDVLTYLSK
tara:strand:+ start:5740 stop:6162 length:423 start_codon:yes stop_codon:yes gene_type:complete